MKLWVCDSYEIAQRLLKLEQRQGAGNRVQLVAVDVPGSPDLDALRRAMEGDSGRGSAAQSASPPANKFRTPFRCSISCSII